MPYFGSSWDEDRYADKPKKIDRYFMYGLRVSYNYPYGVYDDIFCSFKGRDEGFVIVGKKIRATNYESPILVPELTEEEENEIRASVKDKFGFEGEYHYYFIIE